MRETHRMTATQREKYRTEQAETSKALRRGEAGAKRTIPPRKPLPRQA